MTKNSPRPRNKAKPAAAKSAVVKPKRRQRRSTQQVIDLIIEAACEEFERNGYDGAKTAAIARKAGVAEALIFSNFKTKSKLFNDAIFKPLERHLVQFSTARAVDTSDVEGMREGSRQYVLELQQFISRHSRMFKSLLATQLYASGDIRGLSQVEALQHFFERATARSKSGRRQKPRVDPRLIARLSFVSLLGCILFKDWLIPDGLASDEAVSAAISDFILDGLNVNIEPRPLRSRG